MGSPDTLTSGTGATFTQAFDAFGAPDPDNAELTRNGFTGHEHDRDLGLIDMKGRVYDPLAAQFLSADPVMQAPHWSQGMNRYAYVFNDPVNATDPSGFISLPSAIAAVGVVGGHVASVGLIAYGFGLDVGLGLGGAGGVGAMNLAFTPSFSGTPGFSGTVHNAASVAPTAGSATQPGIADALGQNRGIAVGLPRSTGGASAGASGGSGGAGGGPPADRTELPGQFLAPDSPGLYRLSPAAVQLMRPSFDHFSFDLTKVRVRFAPLMDGVRAYADGNLLTLDITHWNSLGPERQLRLLGHETAHSVQFEKLGYVKTRFRTGWEGWTNTHEELYDVPGKLHRIPLSQLDVVDSRFTLEAISEHIMHHIRVP